MEWLIAGVTFTILYGIGYVLNLLWDAGYWVLVCAFAPAVLAIGYAMASPRDRKMFREDLAYWFSWRSK
jgi:hypothetical protein